MLLAILLAAGCIFEPPAASPNGAAMDAEELPEDPDGGAPDRGVDAGAAICGDGIVESPESCDDGPGAIRSVG